MLYFNLKKTVFILLEAPDPQFYCNNIRFHFFIVWTYYFKTLKTKTDL